MFLFVPVVLSTATPEALSSASLKLRRHLTRRKAANSQSAQYDGGESLPHPPDPPNDQVLFVARNPLERNGSTSSLRLHLKNVGLRAMLGSLPSPEPSIILEESVVNTNPNGEDDNDSLANVEIPVQTPATAQARGSTERHFGNSNQRK